MKRYYRKGNKEMIILKGYPCIHKMCVFCTLHFDNSRDTGLMLKINKTILDKIKADKGILEIYNSGSIFELPAATLFALRSKIREKSTQKIITEAHWAYREFFEDMKKFLGAKEAVIKIGVETFNNNLREKIMKKGMGCVAPRKIRSFTNGINLLVGFRGQTKEIVRKDIDIACRYFEYADINILDEKYVPRKGIVDYKIINWFLKEFGYLGKKPNFRIFRKIDEMVL